MSTKGEIFIDSIVIYRTFGSPKTLNTSDQLYHHFDPLSSANNDESNLQPVIAALCMRQNSICGFCGIIGNKADICIIRGPNFLPPILRIKTNQFKALHGDETTDPPR